jgi:hypothetical protein
VKRESLAWRVEQPAMQAQPGLQGRRRGGERSSTGAVGSRGSRVTRAGGDGAQAVGLREN